MPPWGSVRRLVVIGAALAFVVWWTWPWLTGSGGAVDVVVLSDSYLGDHRRPVGDRVREDGRSLVWLDDIADWCVAPAALADAVRRDDPAVVVVSLPWPTECPDAVREVVALGAVTVVVVESGPVPDLPDGVVVVDPVRLVGGEPAMTFRPCEWWEGCSLGGRMMVRTGDGSLTYEGADRVARALVALLP